MRTPRPLFRSIILRSILIGGLLAAIIAAAPTTAVAQEKTKTYTVDDIYASRTFSPGGFRSMRWIENGKALAYLETDTATKSTDIWRYRVSDGEASVLVRGAGLKLSDSAEPISIQNYVFSPDEKKILFTGTLAARSLKTGGNFFIYDREEGALRQLTNTAEEQVNVKFSPDGNSIGFVRSQNIFVIDLGSGAETQLTFDGAEHILNGNFDWAYEEEFSIIDGWSWSPDGRTIAFWQLDERRVPEYPIVDFLPLHQEVKKMRYPKAGDPNSIVRIGAVAVPRGGGGTNGTHPELRWLDFGAPADSTQDIYVPRMGWTTESNVLWIQRLNRLQNRLDLMLFDLEAGTSRIALTENSDTWLEVETAAPPFLRKSGRFLWLSERDGYNHLYLYEKDGKLVSQLTQGKWDVEGIAGVDEEEGIVYFSAGITSPIDRHLYMVRLDGSGFRKVTTEAGSHSVNFAPDFRTYRDSYSDANTPTSVSLHKSDGTLIRVVNDGRIAAMADYPVSPKTFFTFKTTDGVELNGWMIKPHDFDPAKKYPVLMSVYGGPGSQTVRNSWGGADYFWYQMLAQKGYVIVSVDNRGTGSRGNAFKTVTYKNLGRWETNDQVEAAKYLSSLPFVDGSRIGIWGWSYGGYMTLMAMTLGADAFKAGVSVAPVTNWKFYDSIYTERYMQTPALNPEGYKESAPAEQAAKLKGRLMIIHGTADDNVHWQNTVTMVNELIKAGKQFETAFYPGGMHGIGGGKTRAQLFTKITNFIFDNL